MISILIIFVYALWLYMWLYILCLILYVCNLSQPHPRHLSVHMLNFGTRWHKNGIANIEKYLDSQPSLLYIVINITNADSSQEAFKLTSNIAVGICTHSGIVEFFYKLCVNGPHFVYRSTVIIKLFEEEPHSKCHLLRIPALETIWIRN